MKQLELFPLEVLKAPENMTSYFLEGWLQTAVWVYTMENGYKPDIIELAPGQMSASLPKVVDDVPVRITQ